MVIWIGKLLYDLLKEEYIKNNHYHPRGLKSGNSRDKLCDRTQPALEIENSAPGREFPEDHEIKCWGPLFICLPLSGFSARPVPWPSLITLGFAFVELLVTGFAGYCFRAPETEATSKCLAPSTLFPGLPTGPFRPNPSWPGPDPSVTNKVLTSSFHFSLAKRDYKSFRYSRFWFSHPHSNLL